MVECHTTALGFSLSLCLSLLGDSSVLRNELYAPVISYLCAFNFSMFLSFCFTWMYVGNHLKNPINTVQSIPITKVVTATSFHHTDAAAASTHNILLHASAAAVLKTETSIGCNDFDEYNWTDGREHMDEDDLPDRVNQEVTLVFGIKEAKVCKRLKAEMFV